jgi:hypothetical protein
MSNIIDEILQTAEAGRHGKLRRNQDEMPTHASHRESASARPEVTFVCVRNTHARIILHRE